MMEPLLQHPSSAVVTRIWLYYPLVWCGNRPVVRPIRAKHRSPIGGLDTTDWTALWADIDKAATLCERESGLQRQLRLKAAFVILVCVGAPLLVLRELQELACALDFSTGLLEGVLCEPGENLFMEFMVILVVELSIVVWLAVRHSNEWRGLERHDKTLRTVLSKIQYVCEDHHQQLPLHLNPRVNYGMSAIVIDVYNQKPVPATPKSSQRILDVTSIAGAQDESMEECPKIQLV